MPTGFTAAHDSVSEISDKPLFVNMLVKGQTAILLLVICSWFQPAPDAGLHGAG